MNRKFKTATFICKIVLVFLLFQTKKSYCIFAHTHTFFFQSIAVRFVCELKGKHFLCV